MKEVWTRLEEINCLLQQMQWPYSTFFTSCAVKCMQTFQNTDQKCSSDLKQHIEMHRKWHMFTLNWEYVRCVQSAIDRNVVGEYFKWHNHKMKFKVFFYADCKVMNVLLENERRMSMDWLYTMGYKCEAYLHILEHSPTDGTNK